MTPVYLNVLQVAGVNIDGNGYSWLQLVVTDKQVKFLPISNTGNECLAKVYLVEHNKKDLDIGRALVGMGFARAVPLSKDIDASGNYESYFKQLKSSETKAKRSRSGQWHLTLRESWIQWYIRRTIEKIVFRFKPYDKKLPALVR